MTSESGTIMSIQPDKIMVRDIITVFNFTGPKYGRIYQIKKNNL